MGTTYSVKVVTKAMDKSGSEVLIEGLKKSDLELEITKLLKDINQSMSTYIADSEISKFNQSKSLAPVVLSKDFYKVLNFSIQVAEETGGSYDPTLGPVVNLWGFGPDKSKTVPTDVEIAKAMSVSGYKNLSLHTDAKGLWAKKKVEDLYVDLSSSAKGFAVDEISKLLHSKKLNDHLVEVGGEIKVQGKKIDKEWRVAIEKPNLDNSRSVFKSFILKDRCIATSGSYRNYFKSGEKSFSHVIDGATGRPTRHKVISATVIHESCMKADAYATALMVLGPKRAKELSIDKALSSYLIFSDDSKKLITYGSEAFKKLAPMID